MDGRIKPGTWAAWLLLTLAPMNFFQATGLLHRARKVSWLILAGLAVAASSVQGRLAEPRAQIEARYGKPLSQQDNKETSGLSVCRHEHDGLSIEVTYIQGVCYGESYARVGKSTLTYDEAQVLLEANRCGLTWVTVGEAATAKLSDSSLKVPESLAGDWLLCAPNYTGYASAGWQSDEHGNRNGAFWIQSLAIKKYVEDVRAQKAKTALKGF